METIQADLIEMRELSQYNQGYSLVLTVIDVFSKYAFARALKTKNAREVSQAMRSILESMSCIPKNCQTDLGKEFYNSAFSDLMNSYSIQHYSTASEIKCGFVERFNRTLKAALFRRFTKENTLCWVHFLEEEIEKYNTRRHRSIQMAPIDVTKENEAHVWLRLYHSTRKRLLSKKKKRLKVGDYVRISRVKSIFGRGYTPNWSEEVFKILQVKPSSPHCYVLADMLDRKIEGTFYEPELQRTAIPKYARIERVLARKGKNLARVRWKGYSQDFDEWIQLKRTRKL